MPHDRKLERLLSGLHDKAFSLGFDDLKITSAETPPETGARLQAFVDKGYHGGMDWMAETLERRVAPTALWPDARSVIMLAMNYGPDGDPLAHLDAPETAGISVYARNRDYHDIIKGRLKEIAAHLVSRGGGDVKVFVDTAPVMEKPLAASAGLGWQGKHTNLVSRSLGSWFFLGSIFTTLDLAKDTSERDHCGSCRACLDSCPTDAFPAPYQLDARRCISYLTIEHAGPIPEPFRKPMGNRIYGCDDCLAACPWNKFASAAREAKLQARDDLQAPRIEHFLTFGDGDFRKFFSGSPIKRIGRDRFLRNVLIAAGNSGEQNLLSPVLGHLDDDNPLVRGAAVWALAQLSPAVFDAERTARTGQETDAQVLAEWQRAD